MSNNAQNLAVLTSKQYLVQDIMDQTGSGLDFHSLFGKLPRPKKGFVLPGYRFCGPFNPLNEQVDKDGNALEGHEPYNQVDDICRINDQAYKKLIIERRNTKLMISCLNSLRK